MKSSDTDASPDQTAETGIADAAPLLAATSSTLYSIIAVYLPVSILATGLPAITALVSKPWPGQASSPWGFLTITVIGTALASSFFYHFTKTTKVSQTAPGIRGAVIAMILAYVITSLLRIDRPWSGRFIPGFINILAPLIALYVWYSVLSASRLFRARELLETYTARYDGAKLQQAMLEEADVFTAGEAAIKKTKLLYTIQILVVIALTIVCIIIHIPLPILVYILLVLVCINTIFVFSLFALFKDEHFFASEGISLSASGRTRNIAGILLFIAAAASGALILSSNKSFLPFSLITDFLAWIGSLFPEAPPRQYTPEALPPIQEPILQENPFAELMNMPLENSMPFPFWEWLRNGLIALVILGFIWFMVKPLFAKGFFSDETLSFGQKLRRLIAEWFKTIKAAAASFVSLLKRGEGQVKLDEPDAGRLRRLTEEMLAGYSPQKRREMKNSVTLFLRLILWGSEQQNVTWKPSDAPGEYCAKLSGRVAEKETAIAGHAAAIIRCGALFEEALYSQAVLPDAKRAEFRELVQGITAERG
jgi:hypothetical protein